LRSEIQLVRNEINDVHMEVHELRNDLRVRVDMLVPKMIVANIASMIGLE